MGVRGIILVAVVLGCTPAFAGTTETEALTKVIRVHEIDKVWAGHPVGFALLTHGDRQFVSYYDKDRRMMVASRRLGGTKWTYRVLPETTGWDSHNYITMAADDEGHLHLAGNMHNVPLIYFRTTKPLEIETFERVERMTGERESRVTYPQFFHDAQGQLVFTYRDGASGSGDHIYNVYDTAAPAWRRLTDQPLTSGEGKMNAYLHGPVKGPDGRFHLCWIWRDTPDCETNHDICYSRSPDLVHWEKSDGTSVSLPMTLQNCEVVDPVPAGGGAINGNVVLGFDEEKRPIVSYHKFDKDGKTQIYNARREGDAWRIYQTSDWDYRWDFRGRGSIIFEIGVGPVKVGPRGEMKQTYRHANHGSGTWVLDPANFKIVRQEPPRQTLPREVRKKESTLPEMQVKIAHDLAQKQSFDDDDVAVPRFVLKWETLGTNRDRPREMVPPPSTLRLFELAAADEESTR